jgi:hypothetical protein
MMFLTAALVKMDGASILDGCMIYASLFYLPTKQTWKGPCMAERFSKKCKIWELKLEICLFMYGGHLCVPGRRSLILDVSPGHCLLAQVPQLKSGGTNSLLLAFLSEQHMPYKEPWQPVASGAGWGG